MANDYDGLKKLLEEQYSGSFEYLFKFIVPSGKINEIETILPKGDIVIKSSKTGIYSSVTLKIVMQSPDEVIKIYKKAAKIEGLISL